MVSGFGSVLHTCQSLLYNSVLRMAYWPVSGLSLRDCTCTALTMQRNGPFKFMLATCCF